MEQGNINKQGRIFQFGKALGEDFRSLVIQPLVENGADSETRVIPRGVMSKISANFKVSKNTVKNVWMTYCEAGFALLEAVNKKRGHAPKGQRAIEV